MQLRLTGTGVLLEEADDFKSFRVVIGCGLKDPEAVETAFEGIARFADEQTAWVYERALRSWLGLASDRAWQEGLDAMIVKARPFGWIDEEAHAIKAHVVYEPECVQ